jgi:hypothetical protein
VKAGILTAVELAFLSSQTYSLSDVVDGRHLSSIPERADLARMASKLIVLRDPSRSKCGHRLTTTAGHCFQCDPKRISFAKRPGARAFVYIAASQELRLIKVGLAVDIYQRLRNLDGHGYGGLQDWVMLFYAEFDRSGEIEQKAHHLLADFSCKRTYLKDGRNQIATEIFSCNFSKALNAVSISAQGLKLSPLGQAWKSPRAKEF